MTTEWVSSVPGSTKLPPSVIEPFSLIVEGDGVTVTLWGATFWT
jgi:hypothetical protein